MAGVAADGVPKRKAGRPSRADGGTGQYGKPEHVPTDELRQKVLDEVVFWGKVGTARRLDIAKSTLEKHYAEEIALANEKAVAAVSGRLFQKAMAGDGQSIRFFLLTRGKGEWSPKIKHEHTGEDGGPIETFNFAALIDGKTEDELRAIRAAVEILTAAGAAGEPAGLGEFDEGIGFPT